MNSIHRIGLTIAGLAGVMTIATAVGLQGYSSGLTAAQAAAAQPAADTQGASPTANPTALDPETIYVNPAATPAIITITNTPPPTRGRHRPVVTVPAYNGDDGGNDGGGD
jgi:hypothetical protein